MTERERLIELITNGDRKMWGKSIGGIKQQREYLADYLLENGVSVPPCNVGDVLYKPKKIGSKLVVVEYVITTIMSIKKDEWIIRYRKERGQTHHQCNIDEIGETIFLGKEEAVQAKGGAE